MSIWIWSMSIKNMDFERHSASHFGIVLYESLNRLLIVTVLWMPRKSCITATKLSCVLFSFLGNSSYTMIFFRCGPTKTPALSVVSNSFSQRSWRYGTQKLPTPLSAVMTYCLMRPNLMCTGVIRIFWRAISISFLILLFTTETLSAVASLFCDSAP